MRIPTGVLLALLVACGSKTGLKVDEATPDMSMPVDMPLPPPDLPADLAVDLGVDFGTCVPFRAEARLASLDIFVAMDSSGSMEQMTAAGTTKFAAITDAIDGFVVAPESEGLGVELTFFPSIDEDVREFCERDRDCGEPDACFMADVCLPSGAEFCLDGDDCSQPGDTCQPLGRCTGPDLELCLDVGGFCPGGSRCRDFGACLNRTSCDVADYQRPAVPLGLLPGVGPEVIAALERRELVGGTPTLPALTGVLDRARDWSVENPGSKVITLLATDGFPESCDPAVEPFDDDPSAGIPATAEVARQGALDGIQTFVIGVFTPDEEADARSNLNTLAMAGGTDEALVITTDEPVTPRLLAVLNELRRSVRTCVYAIPHEGVLPEPRTLQVRILPPMGAPVELSLVEGPDACDPDTGGFFFERDIGTGARPGFLELCPASCSLTAASDEFIVEMQAGCDDLDP